MKMNSSPVSLLWRLPSKVGAQINWGQCRMAHAAVETDVRAHLLLAIMLWLLYKIRKLL